MEPRRVAAGPSGVAGPSPQRLSAAGEPRSWGALAADRPRAPPTPPQDCSAAAQMDGAVAPPTPGARALRELGALQSGPPKGVPRLRAGPTRGTPSGPTSLAPFSLGLLGLPLLRRRFPFLLLPGSGLGRGPRPPVGRLLQHPGGPGPAGRRLRGSRARPTPGTMSRNPGEQFVGEGSRGPGSWERWRPLGAAGWRGVCECVRVCACVRVCTCVYVRVEVEAGLLTISPCTL